MHYPVSLIWFFVQNGLRLTLNIEADDYLSVVTPNQGVRMYIHERSQIPFPSENGLDLSPLMETSIALKRVSDVMNNDRSYMAYDKQMLRVNVKCWQRFGKFQFTIDSCSLFRLITDKLTFGEKVAN